MAEPLKNMYNEQFIETLSAQITAVYPDFDSKSFPQFVFSDGWDDLELKDRMRRISESLFQVLKGSYSEKLKVLIDLSLSLIKEDVDGLWYYMFIPDFVENFGLDYYKESIQSMEHITKLASCEFAIRPFIVRYPETMKQMMKWTKNSDYRVRRLASEGCRSRLPWAMALPEFKKDPTEILPILEELKNDPTDFVYRSVANNLNDISKDNPAVTLRICKNWIGKTKNTDWVVRHACRGLLKQGDPEALLLFGYSDLKGVELSGFNLEGSSVESGGQLNFAFDIRNKSKEPKKLRIEYNIYFMKANGKQAPKIFKVAELELNSGKEATYTKHHSFKPISTRKYYSGEHAIEIVVNGVKMEKLGFDLL